jgi:DNA-binding NarL/FixJ family response regulator
MLRTLIIDDNPVFLDSLSNLLTLYSGVNVVGVADSGEQGLRLARELMPELVIVDLMMPGMNGLVVAETLLQSQAKPRVVIVSLNDGIEYRMLAEASGIERFVCKKDLFVELPSIIAE